MLHSVVALLVVGFEKFTALNGVLSLFRGDNELGVITAFDIVIARLVARGQLLCIRQLRLIEIRAAAPFLALL